MSLRRGERGRLAAVAAALALLLSACPADDPDERGPTPEPGAVRGGILRVELARDVDALDPHRAASPSAWFFARALHRGLLAFPSQPGHVGARPGPDLAGLPRVDRGGTRFRFTIDAEASFAEGSPVRAADARASLERLIRDGRGVARHLTVIRGAGAHRSGRARRVAGIRARGDVLVIRTRRRAPELSWVLAHPQAAILPAATPPPGEVPPADIVGAGPYVLVRYRPERRIVLGRNDEWHDDPVRVALLDGIDARVRSGPRRAAALVAAGRGDLLLEPGPPDLGPVPGGDARAVDVTTGCVRYLFLNVRVIRDRSLRRAIDLALDREAFEGEPAGTLLPPPVWGHEQDPDAPEADPAGARTLLAGRTPSFELVIADARRDRAEARAIQRALVAAGITVRVRRAAPALLHERYGDPAARVPAGIATWCADWPGLAGGNVLGAIADPRRTRTSGSNPIYAGFRSSSVAVALRRAERAPLARAAEAWAQAAAAVARTGAVLALHYPVEEVLVSTRLRGLSGAQMFPRGDPAALWLDPAAGAGS